jgi:hypothetical protein
MLREDCKAMFPEAFEFKVINDFFLGLCDQSGVTPEAAKALLHNKQAGESQHALYARTHCVPCYICAFTYCRNAVIKLISMLVVSFSEFSKAGLI